LAGTFQTFVYKLLWERANLRIENICQFYKDPIQYAVLKDKYGKPQVDETGKEIKKPVYREVAMGEVGDRPRWIKIKPEMCQAKYFIRLEPDIEPTMSRQERLEVAMALLEEAKVNPTISVDEATLEFLRALGKNPEKFYIKPSVNEMKASINGQLPPENGGVNPNQGMPTGVPQAPVAMPA